MKETRSIIKNKHRNPKHLQTKYMIQSKSKVILKLSSAVNNQDCFKYSHELEEKTVISVNQEYRMTLACPTQTGRIMYLNTEGQRW